MNYSKSSTPPIVFFDGVCNFCNGSVNLLLKLDRRHKLRFASLQGETAKEELHPDVLTNFDSIVFLKDGQVFFRSQAVFGILMTIGGLWKLMAIFYIIPICWRDWLYNFIAKNRYKWFGKKEACRLPTEKEKGMMLP